MTSKLFTCAGITTHSRDDVTITKVRVGNDYVRLIKQLSSNKKIGVREPFGGRDDGYLDAVRVELVELPSPMLKEDAAKYIATLPVFQSAEDQLLLQEYVDARQPKAPRAKKEKQVKVKGDVDSITNRTKKKMTAEELLATAFAEEPTVE